MLIYLLLPTLIYAAPLSITWFLFGDRPGIRLRFPDAAFMLWCVAFYPLFWLVFYPIARGIPPHRIPSMGSPGPPYENWIQVIAAPGVQGLLTGIFLWYLLRAISVFIATLLATLVACVMLMSMQFQGEYPSAIVWNLVVVVSIVLRGFLAGNKESMACICPRCKYDLSGGPHLVCPECGASLHPA